MKKTCKQELLKLIGSIEQIGGVKDYTFNDGKAKGVRVIEIDTGVLRFFVLPDRGMDIAQAYFNGEAISWISKTGITAPTYYEKDGTNFLRGFFGGLVTTCGLKNIGRPYLEKGLHGRISNIPSEKVSVFADWEDDEYVMKVSGQVRESVASGENLVIKRTITTKLFSSEFTLEDTVINEGFSEEEIALCYHCNFGYPLVSEDSVITNVPEEISHITSPVHGAEEECIPVIFTEKTAKVGIENKSTRVELTYNTDTLPDFLLWKMLGEGDYAIGLEPRTTVYGGENIRKNNKYVILKPFEEYKTYLKFEVNNKDNK